MTDEGQQVWAEMHFDWNTDQTRFGARPSGSQPGTPPAAFVDVLVQGNTLVVLHTETDSKHQGQGLAGRLTRELLDQARAEGWQVEPRCPYTAGWLQRHPEYADLRVP